MRRERKIGAMEGKGAILCESARVVGEMPESDAGAKRQRKRWEHGHLQTIVSQVPRMLWGAMKKRDLGLLVLAMDLGVPPLSLLVIIVAGGMVAAMAGGFWMAAEVLASGGAALVACVGLAWARFGRGSVSGWSLLLAPGYAASKIFLYAGFVIKPEREWVRTERVPHVGLGIRNPKSEGSPKS